MKGGLVCLCLLISMASIAQDYAALTIFKVAFKKSGSKNVSNKILYEVKPNELILVDDGLYIKHRLLKNENLKFSKLMLGDSAYSLDINRRNKLLVGIGKFALIGSLMGVFGGSLVNRVYSNTQNRGDYAEDLASDALVGALIGIITSPVSLVFSRKYIRKEELRKEFSVKELEKFSVKWQLENRKLVE